MKLRYASSLAFCWCILAASSFAQTGGVVLRADAPMGAVLQTGDNISFEYQTREDAAVVVFNIDSQGLVHVLHPQGEPEVSQAMQSYTVPDEGSGDIVIDSPTGVEFVFALAVKDPSAINTAQLDRLREIDNGGEPYRVEGDPFLGANQIASDLVSGVSNRNLYFGYTFFYVNDRVEYPCYLCSACDGVPDDPSCEQNRVVQSFDRDQTLTYPLSRAYEIVTEDQEISAEDGAHIEVPEGSDVDVNFYPYGVEARAVDPFYSSLWNDWWYDPFYWYGPYYPYYSPYWGSGWNISIGLGWGWGWGWWGGYYCSGWYAPCGWYSPYCGWDYYGGGGGGGYTQPDKFKAKFKTASALTSTHAVAAKRDGSLRIASKDVQSWKQVSKGVSRTTSATYAKGRSKGAFDSYKGGSRVIKSAPSKSKGFASSRSGSSTRIKGTPTRGYNSTRKGVSNVQRGGGGYKSKAYSPGYRGSSKSRPSGSYAPRSSGSRSKGSSYAPRSGSSYRSGAMKSSSSYRGGSSMRSAPSSRGGSSMRSAPSSRGGSSMRSAPSYRGGGGGRSFGGGHGGSGK